EIAGWVIANGSASSITGASPAARRARIARRVGSASAENVASRWRERSIANRLYNHLIIHGTSAPVKWFNCGAANLARCRLSAGRSWALHANLKELREMGTS